MWPRDYDNILLTSERTFTSHLLLLRVSVREVCPCSTRSSRCRTHVVGFIPKNGRLFFRGICLWRLLVTRIPRGFHGNKEKTGLSYCMDSLFVHLFVFPYRVLSASPENILEHDERSRVSLLSVFESREGHTPSVCRQCCDPHFITLSDKIDSSWCGACLRPKSSSAPNYGRFLSRTFLSRSHSSRVHAVSWFTWGDDFLSVTSTEA
jgi:hypothetical protein